MAGTLCGIRYGGKANRQRYQVVGEWHLAETSRTDAFGWVRREYANLAEKRTGNVYQDGAYRVIADGKTALFFGETAWSDSRRLYDDLLFARRRQLKQAINDQPSTKGLQSLLP